MDPDPQRLSAEVVAVEAARSRAQRAAVEAGLELEACIFLLPTVMINLCCSMRCENIELYREVILARRSESKNWRKGNTPQIEYRVCNKMKGSKAALVGAWLELSNLESGVERMNWWNFLYQTVLTAAPGSASVGISNKNFGTGNKKDSG